MAKIIYIFGLLLLVFAHANAQKIYIKRSDVDSARSNFVTATYPFTIDIYISDLLNTNGVAFELDYSLANFIKFSQWKVGDYSTPQVVANEDTAGNGRLIVAVSSGEIVLPDSVSTPKVISLEFVTLQNATNDLINTFKFYKPVATVIDTNGRGIFELNSDTTYFNIHGFINVWPGDTDNNGLVDHLDFAPITQYIGFGSLTKNMKSFKRKSGSSIWGPHRGLSWDSAAVTFADCDGNGDITISDMLIVTYNLGKDTTTYSVKKNQDEIQSKLPRPTYYDNNAKRIPLQLSKNIGLYAITGKIDISNFHDDIIGVEPGDIFNDYPFNYSVIKNNEIHFALGSYTKELSLDKGIFGNFVVDNNFDYNISNYITELKGIDKYGNIVDLQVTTDVEENPIAKIYIMEGDIFNFNSVIDEINVYDILGNKLYNYVNSKIINTSNWNNGIYIVQYYYNNQIQIIKYLKTN